MNKVITLAYLVVPQLQSGKGQDAWMWVAFEGIEQTSDVPFECADTPQEALEKLLARQK